MQSYGDVDEIDLAHGIVGMALIVRTRQRGDQMGEGGRVASWWQIELHDGRKELFDEQPHASTAGRARPEFPAHDRVLLTPVAEDIPLDEGVKDAAIPGKVPGEHPAQDGHENKLVHGRHPLNPARQQVESGHVVHP